MLIKVIKKQTIFLLKQKEASLTFILLLAVVLGNYITNVLTFRGTDISQMYQPMKLLALSLNKVYFSANIQLLIVMIQHMLVFNGIVQIFHDLDNASGNLLIPIA